MLNSLMATVSDMEVTESTGIQKFLDAVNKGIIGSVAEFIGNISILFPILVFLHLSITIESK